ncbi:MAG: hypothetical protein H0X66_20505 [Verrucomicrobia bacterium]|nr:hypothetical protein [Verrucomicrobiota bacterium]
MTSTNSARFFRWFSVFIALCAVVPMASAQTILFQDKFENPTAAGLPRTVSAGGVWTTVNNGSNPGAMRILTDTNGWFGPVNNRFLSIENGVGFQLYATQSLSNEVVTLSFDFVDRRTTTSSAGNERLSIQIWAGDGSTANANRAHVLSLQNGQEIRSNAGTYPHWYRLRWDTVVNNSAATINYISPLGTNSLLSGRADVWINGKLAASNYAFAREAGTGPIRSFSIQTFSTDRFSLDLDNVTVYEGAKVLLNPAPVSAAPRVYPDLDGNLIYTRDVPGNRIPDFSSAGYMGGGVPIPTVPVRVTLHPAGGVSDDTARIQQAIDDVSAMSMDEDGFRGAVLLKAGTYRASETLRIHTSGVVLRGEGNTVSGTVLIATGPRNSTNNPALVRIAGTGSPSEVSSSRRQVSDIYVPVGARTFALTNISGMQVGDQVIVHRPSTAEWISDIGMDQIPPRSDGLPVTQWQPGSFDLRFDRIITAINGTNITLDAPILNSLERKYGGGSVYRYNFNNRISQVGIENIRGVSEYISPTDEEHAWDFVVFDAVQNGWARQLVGLHFCFSTVTVGRNAKWITVEDSSLLDPISQNTGSRRYPFYIFGQLSLVQRCYGRNARHDFGTSSLVCGPNVFLDSSADNSFADTGPHQRWAVGTLYDNIRIPNHDINVQNRLNFGSGHGWSGANHVVWNCTAKRICVQNPPTAQNWAIGVIGTKWAGSFPSYASDGFWESHGAKVSPNSLYLKQLEERLNSVGGANSILNFTLATSLPVQSNSLPITIARRGIRDRSLQVQLEFADETWRLLEQGSDPVTVFFPAHTTFINLSLPVKTNAWVPTATSVTATLKHGSAYSAGATNQIAFNIAARPVSFDSWKSFYFTTEELQNPIISGDQSTPAGDGIGNVLKYAFGLSPLESVPSDLLPKPYIEDGKLTLAYERIKALTDLTYSEEVSNDLESWTSDSEQIETLENVDLGTTRRIKVQDRFPMTLPQRFMQLKVTRGIE